jgi:UDP-N-acetylmuramoyl-tripeptide--D-alanyl-D-alanine ligase
MEGRSRIINGKVTVIEDSYNSNVESAGQILSYLRELPWNGGKHVVLGSMKELGFATAHAHMSIGRQVASMSVQGTFLFGKEMESAYSYLRHEAFGNALYYTDDYEELEHQVTANVRRGDLVLLKGSRAMAMERLVQPLSLVS